MQRAVNKWHRPLQDKLYVTCHSISSIIFHQAIAQERLECRRGLINVSVITAFKSFMGDIAACNSVLQSKSIGNFSNDEGGRQRECQKSRVGLITKTTSLHSF